MSCHLLQNPDKSHRLVDDLESVFWVLLWAMMERFALPGQVLPIQVFEEVEFDKHLRTVGGESKQKMILSGNLLHLRFSSKALEKLLKLCNTCWQKYHYVRSYPDDEYYGPDAGKILEDAALPSFWLAQLKSVLDDRSPGLWDTVTVPDAEGERARAETDGSLPISHYGEPIVGKDTNNTERTRLERPDTSRGKRPLADSDENSADTSTPCLRRSKRLKLRKQ